MIHIKLHSIPVWWKELLSEEIVQKGDYTVTEMIFYVNLTGEIYLIYDSMRLKEDIMTKLWNKMSDTFITKTWWDLGSH